MIQFRLLPLTAALAVGLTAPLAAQTPEAQAQRVVRLEAAPASIELRVGEVAELNVTAYDAAGNALQVPLRYAAPRRALRAGERAPGQGIVMARAPGDFEVVITTAAPGDADPVSITVPVKVRWPAVARLELDAPDAGLYVGTTIEHTADAFHDDGTRRPEPEFRWTSSDPAIASVDRFGTITGNRPGSVTLTARIDDATATRSYVVRPFPATSLEIVGGAADARTGDVLTFETRARGDAGVVEDLPVTWSYTFVPDDTINAPGAAAIVDDGKFVAEVAGRYTVLASAGPLSARATVAVSPRDVVRPVTFASQGTVSDVHTSDLWIYEGRDGRDYAVTGTWGAAGYAYFWDVTDPARIVKYDSIQVDARTVNDVKVSPDGRYAALSREGASNRRNGVVIIDLADPRNPRIASVYDEGLTGGVHNMFATNDHLFALSAGDKYMILDVTDLYNPRFVSEYNHPDSRIHDVWVHDGVAYSSEWGTGVVVVDVGNGRWGGTIENPKFVTNIPYPVGATHAAFPYHQEDTGKLYLFLGDEIMSRDGMAWGGAGLGRIPEKGGTPSVTSGYVHIIDFTDPENPKDVARYHVPEFGTHNIWVEDDVLYQAYYEGGVRMVDVAGELMGNLADQGREIAVFKAFDPNGYAPNAPMAWGAQPHKGYVFFSDFNSGLWAIKVGSQERPTT